MLVVFRGLPGTGKSHLVRLLLARRPEFLVLSRDVLRAAIIPRPSFGPDEKALVDDVIVHVASLLLARGRSVVIDGMALSSAARVRQFAAAAAEAGAAFRLVQCTCTEATALARIAGDGAAHPAGDRGEALYLEVKRRFEPAGMPCLVLDTEGSAEESLHTLLAYMESGSR
jgi:predicted kinase